MDKKAFRMDLYYRLADVEIKTPPLVDIQEDIIRIVRHLTFRLLNGLKSEAEIEKEIQYFDKKIKVMKNHTWPGNVRELVQIVRRRLLLGDDVIQELEKSDYDSIGVGSKSFYPSQKISSIRDIHPVEEMIQKYVREAFQNRGSLAQHQLAKRLGISVNTMKKYLKEE